MALLPWDDSPSFSGQAFPLPYFGIPSSERAPFLLPGPFPLFSVPVSLLPFYPILSAVPVLLPPFPPHPCLRLLRPFSVPACPPPFCRLTSSEQASLLLFAKTLSSVPASLLP